MINYNPVLACPLKQIPSHSPPVDFSLLLNYIENVYQESRTPYADAVNTLNILRQDYNNKDSLYKYFTQLEYLSLRFPIDGDNIKILFTWGDSFNQDAEEISQYSLAYEKACILYNLASVCSSIAG